MIYLKQSTASQEVPLGHFVDDADGKTAETGLTIANTDIKIWKAGATTLANKTLLGATHISGGIYYAVLDATDTNTLGSLVIFVAMSGALAVRLECCVLAANVYDSLIGGGDLLDINVDQVGGTGYATALVSETELLKYGGGLRTGTAQAGAAGTVTLDAGASAVDDFYNKDLITIVAGTGAGQARFISDYVGATKVATVIDNWLTNPASDSVFVIFGFGTISGASAPTAVDIRTEMDANSTKLISINTKTAFLPSATAGAAGGLFIAGTNAATTISGAFTATFTGNLTGSVASVSGNLGGSVGGSVASVLGNLGGNVLGTIGSLAAQAKADVTAAAWTTQMTESYAADGVAPTPAQALFGLTAMAMEKVAPGTVASSVTVNVYKLNGSTLAFTLTLGLDSSGNVISVTRAS